MAKTSAPRRASSTASSPIWPASMPPSRRSETATPWVRSGPRRAVSSPLMRVSFASWCAAPARPAPAPCRIRCRMAAEVPGSPGGTSAPWSSCAGTPICGACPLATGFCTAAGLRAATVGAAWRTRPSCPRHPPRGSWDMTRPARTGETPPQKSEVPEAQTAERARELAEALEDLRREVAAREAAEEALRQAQKLETVGQLAGGIAHDFNNHLTSILGGLFLLERRIEQGRSGEDDLRRYISTASVAARRAGLLAQRLLTLARRQPPPDPKRVDLNEVIASMEDLLRSVLGPAVTLELALATGAWPTLCDPGQLENAV